MKTAPWFFRILVSIVIGFPFSIFAAERVEDGTVVPTKNNLHRSVAMMVIGNGGLCSASFLTPTVLLTAGHCTKGAQASTTKIKLRTADGVMHWVGVAALSSHPLYKIEKNSNSVRVNYDIGLIRLAKAFPFPVRPLRISSVAGMKSDP